MLVLGCGKGNGNSLDFYTGNAQIKTMKSKILGVDFGTQKIKAAIVDETGNIIGDGTKPLEIFSPKLGWVEQSPEDWWTALCEIIREMLKKSRISPSEIAACGLSTQRFTKIAVDINGNPLRPAILWNDDRKMPNIIEKYDLDLNNLNSTERYFLPIEKIFWIKEYEPKIFQKTYKFLSVQGWITHKLTGKFIDSWSSSFADEFLDLKKFNWDDEKLQRFEIPREKLADLTPPGSLLGHVSEKAAKDTGLPEDLPLIAGAGDKMSEALGVGVLKTDTAMVSCGTFTPIQIMSRELNQSEYLINYLSAVPKAWSPESAASGFSIVSWFIREFGRTFGNKSIKEIESKEEILDTLATKIKAGSDGLVLLPYFIPFCPVWKPLSQGAIIGLNLSHKAAHLYRAILEGIAYGVRESKEKIEKVFGKIKEIRICGGGAGSDVVAQILADSLGMPVYRTESKDLVGYVGSKGAAIDAAKGVGIYNSVINAAKNMIHVKERFEPVLKNYDYYSKIYKNVYKKLYRNLRENIKQLRQPV